MGIPCFWLDPPGKLSWWELTWKWECYNYKYIYLYYKHIIGCHESCFSRAFNASVRSRCEPDVCFCFLSRCTSSPAASVPSWFEHADPWGAVQHAVCRLRSISASCHERFPTDGNVQLAVYGEKILSELLYSMLIYTLKNVYTNSKVQAMSAQWTISMPFSLSTQPPPHIWKPGHGCGLTIMTLDLMWLAVLSMPYRFFNKECFTSMTCWFERPISNV